MITIHFQEFPADVTKIAVGEDIRVADSTKVVQYVCSSVAIDLEKRGEAKCILCDNQSCIVNNPKVGTF